jgi:hypothetical protein
MATVSFIIRQAKSRNPTSDTISSVLIPPIATLIPLNGKFHKFLDHRPRNKLDSQSKSTFCFANKSTIACRSSSPWKKVDDDDVAFYSLLLLL